MNKIINNRYLENLILYSVLLITSFFISKSFGYTMLDDGWRHLAMALNKETIGSWGELFINSLYKEYDPWFLWHMLLKKISLFAGEDQIHIIVNTFVYFALSSWYFIVLSKFTPVNKYIVFIFAIFLPLGNTRYFYLRPDVLSGLFLLYAVIINRKYLLALLSIAYMPFYYIFWFYFGYLGIINLILKKYKEVFILFVVTLAGFAFHLYIDFDGYIDIMQNVLNNDSLIQGYSVGESKPFLLPIQIKNFLGSGIVLFLLIILSLLILYVFKPKDEVLKYLILFMPLIISQYRFFNLLAPLVDVYIVMLGYRFYIIVYEHDLNYAVDKLITLVKSRSYFGDLGKRGFKILAATSIALFLGYSSIAKIFYYNSVENQLNSLKFLKSDEYKNKRILFSTMNTSLFMSIYLNPTAKYIPSCSLGWVNYDQNLKEIYFKLITNKQNLSTKEFFEFIKYNKVDIIIIDARSTTNIGFNERELYYNGYKFKEIINENIVLSKK